MKINTSATLVPTSQKNRGGMTKQQAKDNKNNTLCRRRETEEHCLCEAEKENTFCTPEQWREGGREKQRLRERRCGETGSSDQQCLGKTSRRLCSATFHLCSDTAAMEGGERRAEVTKDVFQRESLQPSNSASSR